MKKHLLLLMLLTCLFCYSSTRLELLIPQTEILYKIRQTSAQLNRDYQDKELTIIMIMKGALCITSDLIHCLNVPFTLECIKASSYGKNGTSNGKLTLADMDNLDLFGKDVLIIDDIFDTGNTMRTIVEQLREKKPNSIKTLVLLLKKKLREDNTYQPDYALFEIENRFVIGYGLDYKELYRGLPGIYAFANDTPPN